MPGKWLDKFQPIPDVFIAIDDSTLLVRIQHKYEIMPIDGIPFDVATWIHFLQKRFGEPEEIA